jgi:hypothetical protein
MHYSLWHRDTGDNIGDFDSEAAALGAVREEIELNNDADELMLEVFDSRQKVYLAGQDLRELAFASRNTPQPA